MKTLYAHRGAAAEEPENTLPSFRRALELGATALETDVHLTSDGVVVVSHDATGARMANLPAPIARHTLADVQSWDAGWGFTDVEGQRPFARRGYRIPTLEQLILEFPGVLLNVDAKPTCREMIPTLLATIRRHRAQDRVRIASFSAANLIRARRQSYEGPLGLSRLDVAALLGLPLAAARLIGFSGRAAQLPVHAGPLRLDTPRLIAKAHALGLRVDYWTVNDLAEARRLLALGADGVMTDDPRAVVAAFREQPPSL